MQGVLYFMATEEKNIWHPAFYEAIEIEFINYANELSFEYEYQLTTQPLRIDAVIIKKKPNIKIEKNIGQIFKGYNIVEYKSPKDNLTADEYNKVFGYAYIFAYRNKIDTNDITISFVVSTHPQELLDKLESVITQPFKGIYYIKNDTFKVQIIESKELPLEENLFLNALRNNLDIETLKQLLLKEKEIDPTKVNTYMYVINKANYKRIEGMFMDDKGWEEFLKRHNLVDPFVAEKEKQEAIKTAQKAAQKEKQDSIIELAKNFLRLGNNIEQVAEGTGLPISTVKQLQY